MAPSSIDSGLIRCLKVDVLREQRVEPAAKALGAAIAKHGFPTPPQHNVAREEANFLKFFARRGEKLWSGISELDALTVWHLLKGNLESKKAQAEITQAYERARTAGYEPGEFASVIDHLRFVAQMLPLSRPKRRAAALAPALEAIIKKLGS